MTTDTDLLLVAEKLGNALDRLDRLESELTAQAVPIQAAGSAQDSALRALEAALAGIKALNQHVLGNDLGALSARVDEAGKQFEAALASIEGKIGGVSADFSAQVQNLRAELSAVSVARRELSAVKDASAQHFAELSSGFSAEVKSLREELAAKVAEFATPKTIRPAGEWTQGVAYERLAVVTLNGSSYISLADGNTEKPSGKSAKWQVMARRGGGGLGGGSTVGFPLNFRTTSYSATVDAGFNDEVNFRSVALTGNLTFTGSGYQAGRMFSFNLSCDSSARTLTFPSGWVFVGVKPSAMTASKTAILSLVCYGPAEANVVAAYAEQI